MMEGRKLEELVEGEKMGGLMEGEKMDRLMEGERMGELGDRWKEAGWMDKLIPEGNSHKQKVTKKNKEQF